RPSVARGRPWGPPLSRRARAAMRRCARGASRPSLNDTGARRTDLQDRVTCAEVRRLASTSCHLLLCRAHEGWHASVVLATAGMAYRDARARPRPKARSLTRTLRVRTGERGAGAGPPDSR